MFQLKAEAELRNINCRAEAHGEEMVRAIDLKLIAIDAKADKMDGAINGFLKMYYDSKGNPLGAEAFPLRIRHKIDRGRVTIQQGRKKVTFPDVTIKAIQLTPKSGKKVDCTFTVQVSDYDDGVMDKVTHWQREIVKVEVEQRQLDIDEVKQDEPAVRAA